MARYVRHLIRSEKNREFYFNVEEIRSHNFVIYARGYNSKQAMEKMWNNFIKAVKEDKIKTEDLTLKTPVKTKKTQK